MTVTSATQTGYTSQTQSTSSSTQETPKNNQQSRYEMLLDKKYENMSEVERRELTYYNAMRPVSYLDEDGNAALNKALEGKTDIEKFQIKSILELEFMTSVKLNAQGGLDRKKFDSIDTSKSATEERFGNYLETYDDLHPLDTLGMKDIVAKFLNIYKNDSTKDVKNQENSVVDKFLEDLYSKGSTETASAITKETIQNKVNEYAQILMDSRGDTPKSESEISKMLNDYKKELLQDYKKSLDGATNDNMTLEQQAIIKVLLEENTQEASALEKLLATTEVDKKENATHKETRSIKEIIAEYRAMPGMNGIAYEGMFEQQIEDSLKKHEASFIADYPLYEKYKDVFTPMYSNYTTEKANNIGRALDAQFPDFKAIKDKAYLGGTEKDMEDFENMFFDYQAYNKYLREKYDMDITAMGYTQEGTKAYNFAVYEQLEKGVDLTKAKSMAHSVAQTFGGMEGYAFSIGLFNGLPTDMAAAMETPEEEIDYTKQIDLRDVGFEHNFWATDYTKKFGLDELGIKSRILYDVKLYSFLLENNELVDRKFEEFKNRAYEGKSSKEWYEWQNSDGKLVENFKNQYKPAYETALFAKEIYEKYSDKIFTI